MIPDTDDSQIAMFHRERATLMPRDMHLTRYYRRCLELDGPEARKAGTQLDKPPMDLGSREKDSQAAQAARRIYRA